jgi:OPA family sugar phosphate sensor protein UhpC-like MFS transporter
MLTPAHHAWRRRVFLATWLSYVGFYFCRKPFSLTKSAIGKDLAFDATTLGDIGAVYLFTYAAGQFLASWLGPRVGPRLFLLAGMGASTAVGVAFGLSDTRAAFYLLMGLNGLAQATGWSSNVATMAAWTGHEERGRIMGLWSTNFQVGSLLSGLLLPWVLAQAGWRNTFFTGSALLLAVWAVFLAFQRSRPEDVGLSPVAGSESAPAAGGFAWTRTVVTSVLLVGGFYFFVKLIRYALWSWVPFFLERNFGLKGDAAGWVSTFFDIAGMPGVWFAGWASDRFFASRRADISFALVLAMTAFCALLYAMGGAHLGVFVACLGLVGFTLIGPDALMTGAAAMDIGSRAMALRVTAIISGIGSIGPIVQELVIGRMYDAKGGALGPIFALLFGSAALSAAFLAALVARRKRGGAAV